MSKDDVKKETELHFIKHYKKSMDKNPENVERVSWKFPALSRWLSRRNERKIEEVELDTIACHSDFF